MAYLCLVLSKLIDLFVVLLIIRIILSWVMPMANWYTQPLKLLNDLTEPVMRPFRGIIPPIGGLDFSPWLLFLLLNVIKYLLAMVAAQSMV